jgi:ABC-type glycerol-3-phosphate transport system substrate-binding protein
MGMTRRCVFALLGLLALAACAGPNQRGSCAPDAGPRVGSGPHVPEHKDAAGYYTCE